MQFKFLTALLLLEACLAQVSLAQSNTDIRPIDIVGFTNEVKALIEKLKNDITEIFNHALNVFDQLKNKVKSEAQEKIASTKDHLNNVISAAQNQTQEITDKISECIDTSEDQFKQLLTDSFNGVVQCVQKEIDSAFKIIDESNAIVTEARDAVQALPGKFKDCGVGPGSIERINGVLFETAKLQAQLPLKIANQVAETTKYVAGFQTRLEVCATTQVAEAGIKAAKIVAEVGKCAADAIKN